MKEVPDQSVDMILSDLPYGTTAHPWDSIIPLDQLWVEFKRIIKPNRAIVLTASQPFTTALAASNLTQLKYEWIWAKNRPTNFAHAKNKPMKKHENILVFSSGTTVHAVQSNDRMPYFPQGVRPLDRPYTHKRGPSEITDAFFSARTSHREFTRTQTGYPTSILEFPTDQLRLHPTAKPVALFEYLIRTYTEVGELVLDSCMGSGTTAIAAINTNRHFIGFENDPRYFAICEQRINRALTESDAP
jgi:site-specific DNA-methyltransferase (adenine-specific)